MAFKAFKRLLRSWKPHEEIADFSILFQRFKQILEGNNQILEIFAQLEDNLGGEYIFDINTLRSDCQKLSDKVYRAIYNLNILSNNHYYELFSVFEKIKQELFEIIDGKKNHLITNKMVVSFHQIGRDQSELVGGKAANLAEIKNYLDLPTPDGFSITTSAFYLFLEQNQVIKRFKETLKSSPEMNKAELLRKIIIASPLPSEIEKEIRHNIKNIQRRSNSKISFALRSSALGEDDFDRSYAGVFASYLNVSAQDACKKYKEVLASRFSARLREYSEQIFLKEQELPMAVLCQRMVNASASGIIYSVDPLGEDKNYFLITATKGLGIAAVSGRTNLDTYHVSHFHPFNILHKEIAIKSQIAVLGENSTITYKKIPLSEQDEPALKEEQIIQLARIALVIERYFKHPQDIEWSIDHEGNIFILQARVLKVQKASTYQSTQLSDKIKRYNILLDREGQVVYRGIVTGIVESAQDIPKEGMFPPETIIVSKFTSPKLMHIIKRAAAIITDIGSPTGHMATIAREFRVPSIVGTKIASSVLKPGMIVTVDAEANKVYEGVVSELIDYQAENRDSFLNQPEFKILRRLLEKLTSLNLIDPMNSNFAPSNCFTYHDIIRFCHEKAVQELINLHTSHKKFKGVPMVNLKIDIPIGLQIIDIGNGLKIKPHNQKNFTTAEIASVPMKSILEGLLAPGIWTTDAKSFDLSDFMSSMTRFSLDVQNNEAIVKNLAVVSDNYTNLSLRLGYHFNVIDAYISPNINDNYIYFRFVGGVTETDRRHRRAIFLEKVLETIGFSVTIRNDLVVAKIKDISSNDIQKILVITGKLIGFTRQLDTQMVSDDAIECYYQSFLTNHISSKNAKKNKEISSKT